MLWYSIIPVDADIVVLLDKRLELLLVDDGIYKGEP